MSENYDPKKTAGALLAEAAGDILGTKETTAITSDYRPIVRNALLRAGVTVASVEYDGCGDEGQLEPVVFVGASKEALESHLVINTPMRDGYYYGPGPRPEMITLPEATEEFFYLLLEANYPGWEIDEGSYGNFEWDIASDKIELVHSNRYTEVDITEIEL